MKIPSQFELCFLSMTKTIYIRELTKDVKIFKLIEVFNQTSRVQTQRIMKREHFKYKIINEDTEKEKTSQGFGT